MIVKLAIMLLQLVATILKDRSDEELKQIGRNEVFAKTLLQIAENVRIARRIEINIEDADRSDIDRILHDYYRNDGADQ
jgi:hypothetical protein